MPVEKKTNGNSHLGYCGSDFCHKIIWTLFGILIAYGIVFMGTLIRNNLQKYYFIGRMDRAERTIQIDGEGKVTAIPDLGVGAMGTITRADTLAGAQSKSTETMKQLTEKLGALGIAPADIQTTAYNIYPRTK